MRRIDTDLLEVGVVPSYIGSAQPTTGTYTSNTMPYKSPSHPPHTVLCLDNLLEVGRRDPLGRQAGQPTPSPPPQPLTSWEIGGADSLLE